MPVGTSGHRSEAKSLRADARGPSPRPKEHRVGELERELTGLAAHINAATCRFLMLLAEFDRLEGWQRDGVVSCAHWLNWRCGIGMNAAREKVRVARTLDGLPQIRAAFETGELSYSKVRAMTRVATPENETVLLQVARYGTAHHVETMVAKWRSARRAEELARADKQHVARSLHYHYDDDGCLVIKARLPAEQGAVVLAAMQAAMDEIAADEHGRHDVAAETCAGDVVETRAKDVTAETRGGREAVSCQSDRAGDSEDETATKRDVVGVTAETSADDRCSEPERPTLGQRRADGLVWLAERCLSAPSNGRSRGDHYLVNVHIDAETLSAGLDGRSELGAGPALAVETVRRLACDSGLITSVEDTNGRLLNIGRKSRAIPPAIRRALNIRDGGCRFPGCTRTKWLHGHHITHWADGGETALENLVLLCQHHHRLVHEGGFGVHVDVDTPDRPMRFTTPQGAVLPAAPPAKAIAEPIQIGIETFQRKHGLAIDHRTADCKWDGSPMDYDHVGGLLGQRRGGNGFESGRISYDTSHPRPGCSAG